MSRMSETPKGVLETYDWQDVAEDLKERLTKIKEIVNKMPCLWYVDEEIEHVDGEIELKYKEYDTSNLERLLEVIE